jgi:hypothetical protein
MKVTVLVLVVMSAMFGSKSTSEIHTKPARACFPICPSCPPCPVQLQSAQ